MSATHSGGEAAVVAGINPRTKVCELVGLNDDSTWNEARECGYIVVPVSSAVARSIWGEIVPDVFALAALEGAKP